jgi:phosphoribosylformylglycinamidine cyclo-ligase
MGSRYGDVGVDVHKKGIEAFKDSIKGLYKHSFCDIHSDPDMPGYGFVHHADGAGSKPVQNYLNWKETGDINCFRGIAQDTLSMNIGDALCVGIPTSGSFVDYVAINGTKAPKKEILRILSDEFGELFEMLNSYGIDNIEKKRPIIFAGGETADLPDQLNTLDVSGAIDARYKLDSVITGEDIKPGDLIVGLSSGGQAAYEKAPAGEIMCNGLTLARHCLMMPWYGYKYPEIEGKEGYWGPFAVRDKPKGIGGTVGEALTRPTRIFAPVFKDLIEEFGNRIHGIVFNTGGGQTKCLRIGRNIRYIKDALPEPPEIFKLVQKYGEVPWEEMYEVFNMGVGSDVIVDPEIAFDAPKYVSDVFGIEAEMVGVCRRTRGGNKVNIRSHDGEFFEYRAAA